MAPRLGRHSLEDSFDRLLGSLLRGEAGPFEEFVLHVVPGVLEVALGLIQPIVAALHSPRIAPS